ncbi:MAG: nucleotidyltransferase family protein [Alphaproteobacteria bacterium]|nr:nucleotidyltransferase family protein [Alphaproteobacteria bacterium]
MARRGGPEGGPPPRIAALVLAAGRSTRAGDTNKLLAPIGGVAMVARTVARIKGSKAAPVIVVTGHQAEEVRAALEGAGVTFAHNPDYAQGMASSIGAGIAALPEDVEGVLICLGDMPAIEAGEIDRLIAAFDATGRGAICAPVAGGRRGNPVLFARRFFPELRALRGDSGAKAVIAAHEDAVAEVPMAGAGTLVDLDTVDAIAKFPEKD